MSGAKKQDTPMSGPQDSPPVLADAAVRQRIRQDFDSTLIVEAAAGTGKTTELVARIAALLWSGRSTLDRIVAVTFTDKAAGELKLRLRGELEAARQASETSTAERARLEAALAALETAQITTLHSFCLDMLRERPVQARVDPDFEVLADVGSILQRAFDSWYQRILERPPEAVRRLLRRRDWKGEGPRRLLLRAANLLVDRRDFDTPWRRDAFDRNSSIDALLPVLASLGSLADRAYRDRDTLARNLRALQALADRVATRERCRDRDYDLLENELREITRAWGWAYKGSGQWYGKDLRREEIIASRDALKQQLDQFVAAAEADLAAALQGELQEVVVRYQALKQRSGGLDFMDMLMGLRDMLRDDRAVRNELQQRFTHLFVDEFQDTDPLQAEILLLLAASDPANNDPARVVPVAGKLFVVGDPKQAIYRFRRADVLLYERVKEQLCRHGGQVVHLSTSFRALPAIQAAINISFAPEMDALPRRAGQAAYVPLQPHRAPFNDQPALIALPIPAPYGRSGRSTSTAIAASTPEAVVAFVDWLLAESNWQICERRGGKDLPVPIRPRHICLLFRRFRSSWSGDITRPYVRALEARRVPHVLVGGQAFHSREEVIALRTVLTAIEWPDDELSVYASLRGPLFALSDAALFAYRSVHQNLHPLAPLPAREPEDLGEHAQVARALSVLCGLHRGRNDQPIAATIQALLAATRAHAGFAIWPSGEQALANVLRVLDQARSFEQAGATSFRSYVEHLDEQAERGQGGEAPVVEQGTEGVRVMTTHAAKGLEFPIVILCDPSNSRKSRYPSRYIDAERRLWTFSLAACTPAELRDHADEVLMQDDAENVRISYVAATRARDLLVVPVVGDGPHPGWVDMLHRALYPASVRKRDAKPAPMCPRFGPDSVRHRPADTQATPDDAVTPGLHERCAGAHPVVWWDPNVLQLDSRPSGGLRQMEILKQAEGAGPNDDGTAMYERWRQARAAVIETAARPSVLARSVTDIAATAGENLNAGFDAEIQQLTTGAAREQRPAGSRFGTLVHAILADLDLRADSAAVERSAAVSARTVGATEEEQRAAVVAVVATLAHPLVVRAAASPDCRRECPVAVVLEDGSLAEGVVDLAFREQLDQGARWIVVDFKTDRDTQLAGRYRRQLELYMRAIETATNEPCEGVLLGV